MKSETLDKVAISLSAVCLLHCLVAPALLTLAPILSLSAYAEDLIFHQLILWVIVPTSVIALFIGCKKHRSGSILLTGVLGISLLLAIAWVGHDWLGPFYEKWATALAGLVLALSHYLNYRTCQEIRCRADDCEAHHHH